MAPLRLSGALLAACAWRSDAIAVAGAAGRPRSGEPWGRARPELALLAERLESASSRGRGRAWRSRTGAVPGPPGEAPLYDVNITFRSKYDSTWGGATLATDAVDGMLTVEAGVDQSSGIAWARFDDKLNTTGWTELVVGTTTAALVSNSMKMYGAGYVEGLLTATRMSQFYSNFWQILPKDAQSSAALVNIQNMMYREIAYIKKKTNLAHGMGSPEPEDPYWKHVRYQFAQLWGIKDGYNAVAGQKFRRKLELMDVLMINRHSELPELMEAYTPEAMESRRTYQGTALRKPGARAFLQRGAGERKRPADNATSERVDAKALSAANRDWELRLAKHGHCSALVRLAPEGRDLLIGHTTWNDYSKMTRVFKYYDFVLPGSDSASQLIAFSSYPGCISSTDNFYMMDSGLAAMDTSLEVLNAALYDRVPEFPANPHIPNFMHVMAVNRLAHTGVDWTNLYISRNNGVPSSQWLVVDYNKFQPKTPIRDNTLRLVEQAPGLSFESDVSAVLRSDGYWASYNRPYFPDVRRASGHEDAEAKYGELYSFAHAPRAIIFKHAASSISTVFDMRNVMNRNMWPAENVLPNDPGHAISARMDLDSVNHLPNGGIDAKVAGRCLFRVMQCHAISGPSHDKEPVFRWKNEGGGELFSGWPHLGLPDVWNFGWTQMTPSGMKPMAVDTC